MHATFTLPSEPHRTGLGVASLHDGISIESVYAVLEKILSANSFAHSPRHGRFLRFVVEETLEGRGSSLKEYHLGLEVFARKDSFDPHFDAIVRVEASRVRAKLKAYYETEGREDPILIEFRKGSYAPFFRRRDAIVATSSENIHPIRPSRQWLWTASTVVLILSLTGFSLFSWLRPLYRDSFLSWGSSRPRVDANSIAVLPFINVSAEKEAEHFADGLTDEVTNALTQLESLRVVARTSAFQFKGKARDARKIGKELNVSMLLEGSARKSKNSLRVTVQLIDVRYGYETWSDTYDGKLDGEFTIQHEIARAIANALRIKCSGGRIHLLAKQYTRSLDAYNLYLEALYHRNQYTREGLLRAVEHFQQSIAVDPRFAPAYSGLASGYVTLLQWHLLPWDDGLTKAQIAAEKALEIDSHLAQAHAALASVNSLRWRWTLAKTEFDRAIEDDPGDAEVRQMYAMTYLLPMNRLNEALAQIELAIKLDPLSPIIFVNKAKVHYFRREYQQAIDQYNRTLRLSPNLRSAYCELGAAYAKRAQFTQAVNTLALVSGRSDDTLVTTSVGYIYGLMGKVADARAAVAQLETSANQQYVPSYYKALLFLGLGEKSVSLKYLEKAWGERDPSLIYLAVSPDWDGVRSDPRFRTLLDQIGLPKL